MVGKVWLKELKEVLRDRKTMTFVVLFPTVLLPALILGVGLLGYQMLISKQEEVIHYAVVGASPWREQVIEALSDEPNLVLSQHDERLPLSSQINEGRLQLAILLLPGFDPVTSSHNRWQLLYDQTQNFGQLRRIEPRLKALDDRWLGRFMAYHGVPEKVQGRLTTPLALEHVGTAEARQDIGERVGSVLPYILLFLCMMGAMLPALDIGAGEKERGTLETLLMVPLPRTTLVLGKFLVIVTTSMTLTLLTIVSALVWLTVVGSLLDLSLFVALAQMVNPVDLMLLLALLLPISGVFSAILLAVSIFATSFKEGQNYMGGLQVAVLVPAMVATLPGAQLTQVNAWLPIFNIALAIKELLKGTFAYHELAAVFASNLILATLLLWCCVQWFRRESVLFR
ncbi:ABC transporter permease [Ferrimonas sediminicola]|uniref:ABC transporter permease n=1 Tax=Ferrimonas sediminicola TaxID=2569538 RepID=A0A4U1BBN9_9GAMM|nr:ABC transporter permease subunit [Ferrimonas sediminicola]TKB48398.1 ABC transporter permease [Ferrimonas sediminicola]